MGRGSVHLRLMQLFKRHNEHIFITIEMLVVYTASSTEQTLNTLQPNCPLQQAGSVALQRWLAWLVRSW